MRVRGPDPFANIRKSIKTPAHLMRTFQIDQPLATHFRRASCEEVDCEANRHGWKMGFDLTDPERRQAARDIRDKSGRSYTYELLDEGRKIVFTFPAGQRCFERHHLPLERDPLLIVRDGDWRGNPTRRRMRHTSAESFLDHWSSDLDKIKTTHERG